MQKTSTLLALAALVLAPVASAQSRFEVGAGYDFDREAAFIGAGVRAPMRSFPITLAPHADFYFRDNVTDFQGNLDGLYSFPAPTFTPYIGAGLALQYFKVKSFDSDVNAGLNLLAGAEFQTTRLRPYLQMRATINDGTTIGLGAGVIF